MNDTLFVFLSDQILPPFETAMAIAFAIAVFSLFWPALRLWLLSARVALFGLAMLPVVGLLPGLVLLLLDRDQTALVMSAIITALSLPLIIWGV